MSGQRDRQSMDQMVLSGRLPPFESLRAVCYIREARLQSVRSECAERDRRESENAAQGVQQLDHNRPRGRVSRPVTPSKSRQDLAGRAVLKPEYRGWSIAT